MDQDFQGQGATTGVGVGVGGSKANNNENDKSKDSGPSGPCAVCQKPSTLWCRNCGDDGRNPGARIYYCSKEHQTEDWRTGHKKTCQPWKVVKVADDSKNSGLNHIVHYEARRPFGLPTPGTRVMTRHPLLIYPFAIDKEILTKSRPYSTWMHVFRSPAEILYRIRTCISCCGILVYDRVYIEAGDKGGAKIGVCPKCKWPVHNAACASLPIAGGPDSGLTHDTMECSILAGRFILPTGTAADYMKIGVLRAVLLKGRSPADFNQLMVMPYSVVLQPKNLQVLKNIEEFVFRDCGLRHEVDKQTLCKIFMILRANALSIKYAFHETTSKFPCVIFKGEQGRILPHSCVPNCELVIDPVSFVGVVRTIKPVHPGTRLTLNYTAPPEKPRDDRVRDLKKMSVSSCNCTRCADPTESGSEFATLRCQKGNCGRFGGVMRPIYIKERGRWVWRCEENPARPHELSENEVTHLINNFYAAASNVEDEKASERVIDRFVPTVFHENHHAVLMVRKIITREGMRHMRFLENYLTPGGIVLELEDLNFDPSAFSFHKRPVLMREMKKVLEIYKLLDAGLTMDYVDHLFHYILLCVSDLSASASGNTQLAPGYLKEQLTLCTDTLSQCLGLLRGYPASLIGPAIMGNDELEDRLFTMHFYVKYLEKSLEQLELDNETGLVLAHFVETFTIAKTPTEIMANVVRLLRPWKGKGGMQMGWDWNTFRMAINKKLYEKYPDAGDFEIVQPTDVTLGYNPNPIEGDDGPCFHAHGRYLSAAVLMEYMKQNISNPPPVTWDLPTSDALNDVEFILTRINASNPSTQSETN